ncbi:MAG TPA: bifunctional oligoribonuclease/PAP phosphatase NrnA [Actinomycetota bacterium]|nr:bifunctional oligoribonuclease/PAP phosphatase NrnA [Actinomycetota bacterium]
MINESEWDRALAMIADSTRVAICCHVNPDGDALGSMLGLGSFLRRRGSAVWMSWGAEAPFPPLQYTFLPMLDEVTAVGSIPEDIGLFIAIDCADVERLELAKPKFEKAPARMNIDHHVTNVGYADVNLVDANRGSSCEIAYELLTRIGGELTSDEAMCLYTGIVTDTGRFQYSNTSPGTLRVAAELRELGVDHERVSTAVYESLSFEFLKVLGIVLSRAKMENGFVWSFVNQEDLGGLSLDETENFIDTLRGVRGCRLAAFIKEQPEGGYKISLRSHGDVDVAAVALDFGGGGHARAAGFSADGPVEALAAKIKERAAVR